MRTLFRARVRKLGGALHYLCIVTLPITCTCATLSRFRMRTLFRARVCKNLGGVAQCVHCEYSNHVHVRDPFPLSHAHIVSCTRAQNLGGCCTVCAL
jgi:hypothetical protein